MDKIFKNDQGRVVREMRERTDLETARLTNKYVEFNIKESQKIEATIDKKITAALHGAAQILAAKADKREGITRAGMFALGFLLAAAIAAILISFGHLGR